MNIYLKSLFKKYSLKELLNKSFNIHFIFVFISILYFLNHFFKYLLQDTFL